MDPMGPLGIRGGHVGGFLDLGEGSPINLRRIGLDIRFASNWWGFQQFVRGKIFFTPILRICSGEDDGKCAIKCFFFLKLGSSKNNQRVDFCWLVEDSTYEPSCYFLCCLSRLSNR